MEEGAIYQDEAEGFVEGCHLFLISPNTLLSVATLIYAIEEYSVKNLFVVLPITLASASFVVAQDVSNRATPYDEIVVTSSRIETPLRQVATSITVIDRDKLDLKGYSSLADVLRTEASIGVSNAGGPGKATSLRIRGEEQYRTLVMIDGVDMSDPTAVQIGPQLEHIMNSYDVERVEVLRGPQGFMYGADAGGVVNIITSAGSLDTNGALTAEAGELGTGNIGGRLSGGNQAINYSLSYSDYQTEGFNSRSDDTVLQDNDGARNRTVHLKTGWNISDSLSATLVYRDINSEYDYDGCYDSAFATSHDCSGDSDQTNSKISLDYSADSQTHSFSYSQTDVVRDTFTQGARTASYEGSTSEIEYLGSYALSSKQILVFGSDYEENEMLSSFGQQGKRDQLGVYGEYQLGLSDDLFLTGGLRYDDNSDFGKYTSGRVSAAYISDLGDGSSLKYRATYGTGFRAPSLFEVAYNAGPFNWGTTQGVVLDAEKSAGFDLGIDYLTASGTFVQATYFNQKIENEIIYFFDSVSFNDGYLQEGGESKSRGIELAIEQPFGDSLSLNANYTFNETETNSGESRARRPERLANIGISYLAMSDRLTLNSNLRISRDALDVGAVPLDDYQVLDISAQYKLTEAFQLFARGQNILDEEYVEITNFNTQGRTLYAGFRYKF